MIPIIPFCLLGLFLPLTISTKATIDCLRANEECNEYRLDSFAGITSSEECSVLCQDKLDCGAFTYYNHDSFPFSGVCILFEECIYRNPCSNCLTGSSQSDCTCGTKFHGVVNKNNHVEVYKTGYGEPVCKARCASNENCTAYTYYDNNDASTRSDRKCVLLSHFIELEPCESCMSGPENCVFSNSTSPTTTMEPTTTTMEPSATPGSSAMSYSSAASLNIMLTFLILM